MQRFSKTTWKVLGEVLSIRFRDTSQDSSCSMTQGARHLTEIYTSQSFI